MDSTRWGRQLILKSTTGEYLQLGQGDEFLYHHMDGTRTVQDLVLLYFHRFESFAFDRITHLIGRLREHGLLEERHVEAFSALGRRLQRDKPEAVFSRLAAMFVETRIEIRGLDRVLSFLHRWFVWPLFSRPAYALYVILAVLGTAAFGTVLLEGRFALADVFTSEGSVAHGAIALTIAFVAMATIHQLAHIFAAKALGREVPSAGFMITYGLPYVYAQTTDVWLEGRVPRILSSLAGTIADVLVGASAAMFLVVFPHSPWGELAFKLAAVSYAALFMDLNPLFEMDGYYALEDYLEIPGLRSRSLAFVRRDLWRKLRRRERLTGQDRVFAVYGILAVAWLVILVTSVAVFLVTKFRSSIADILEGGSWGSVAMAVAAMVFFVIPVMVALLACAALAVWRTVRWIRSHPALRDPRRLTNAILAAAAVCCATALVLPRLAAELVRLPATADYFDALGEAFRDEMFMPVWGLVMPALVPGVVAASVVFAVQASREVAGSRLAASLRLLALFCTAELLRAAWRSYTLTWGIASPAIAAVAVALEAVAWIAFAVWSAHLLFGVELRLMRAIWRVVLSALSLAVVALAIYGASLAGRNALGVAQIAVAAGATGLGAVALVPALVNYSRTLAWPAWALLLAALGLRNAAALGRLANRAVLAGIQVDLLGALVLLFALLLFKTVLRLSSVSVPARSRSVRQEAGDRARLLDALGFIIESLGGNLTQAYGRRTAAALERAFNRAAEREGRALRLVARLPDDSSAMALDARPLEHQPIMAISDEGRAALDLIERQTRGLAGSKFFSRLMTAVYDRLYWSEREPVHEHLLREFTWSAGIVREGALVETGVDALIGGTPLFEGLTLDERRSLARTMRHLRAPAGETVVREGETADAFYLIAGGSLAVYHEDAPDETIATLGRGDYFGEAAALEGGRRSASVRAQTDAELLALDRGEFRLFVRSHVSIAEKVEAAKELVGLLRRMPAFREVPLAQLALMASLMKPVRVVPGEDVVKQGEIGSSMYVIRQGQVEVVVETDGADKRIAQLGPGEYFGEIALVESVPRTATVRALTDGELAALAKDDFDRRIGTSLAAIQAIGKISSRRRREIWERSTEFAFSFGPDGPPARAPGP